MKRFVLAATLATTVAMMTPATAQSRGDDSNSYGRGDWDSNERAKGNWDGSSRAYGRSRDAYPGYGHRPYGWGGNPYYGSAGSYGRPPMMGPGPYGAPRPPYGAPPNTYAPPAQNYNSR